MVINRQHFFLLFDSRFIFSSYLCCFAEGTTAIYYQVGVTAGKARTNNRNKNQNWMVFRIKVSGANINNRNSVA